VLVWLMNGPLLLYDPISKLSWFIYFQQKVKKVCFGLFQKKGMLQWMNFI
jgi:hypothetical protein